MNYDSQNISSTLSPVILALADWANGNHVQEGTLHTMQQFGFILPNSSGKLEITPYGQQVLVENRLI